MKEVSNISDSTFIKSGNEVIRIKFEDISFIEGLKDYVTFHLPGAKHVSYHTLKALIEKLPDEFMRVHQSFIVNINKIEKIKDFHLYIGDRKIPVSKSYRHCLKDRINSNLL